MTQIFDLGSRRRELEAGTREDEERRADPRALLRRGWDLPRVPVVLERELRRIHETLRVPVSNIARAVLEDAVAIADHASENVEARLKTLASTLEHERDKLRRRVRPDPLEGIFAFQSIRLAQAASCAKCTKELRRGEGAHLGLQDEPQSGAPRVFVCDACVPAE